MNSDAIQAVYDFRNSVAGTNYHKHKRELFLSGLNSMSPDATELLTFCCWHCLFNIRITPVDASKYFVVPEAPEGNPEFGQFLEVLKFYNRKPVRPKNEKFLIEFLARCSRYNQDFYLSLLSKSFIKNLPLVDVQLELDLNGVDPGEIYGTVSRITTSFSDLQFPVVISAVDSEEFALCCHLKRSTSGGSFSYQHELGHYVKIPKLLNTDSKFIITPKYTVVGYSGEPIRGAKDVFHPIDFFESPKEFHNYRKELGERPLADRVASLRGFQADNYLRQISHQYVGYAETEEEVLSEVMKVMRGSPYHKAIISDGDTAKTGKAFVVRVSTTVGIIEDFYVVDGKALGFRIWFNGELFSVAFDFTGRNNALLRDIKITQGKLIEFLYLHMGSNSVGVGIQVLWDAKLWRPNRMKRRGIRIEKCVVCGGTNNPHADRGVCKTCERNMYRIFKQFGPDTWMMPRKYTREKRRASCWEPKIMNIVQYKHQGHLLEAREDGCWRFKTIEGVGDGSKENV